ncbi:MAG: transporter substrate-binding domain-containing protein [Candidimonas sp.]|nr:MAG: transporter substrate-binding domain-containing protein [Candidimonas sp.]
MFGKKILSGFLILSAMSLVGASSAAAQATSQLDTVLQRGKVIVGTSSEAPPFGFVDANGNLVGFDVDIAKLIARSMFGGKENIEFVKQSFSSRWANIQSGKVDFGIQETTIYPDRLLNVAFTRPYQESGIVVVARTDSGVRKLGDLNDSKFTIANLTAPNEKDITERLFPQAKRLTFDNTAAEFAAVASKRATAMTVDYPIALYYTKSHQDMKVVGWVTDPTQNAIFLKQGDFKWWYYLDAMVAEMRGGSLFHQYSEIYKKWFGTEPANLNPEAAVLERLQSQSH